MKEYKIKVTELHSDVVYITAESADQAIDQAHYEASCEYECLYDTQVIGVYEKENNDTKTTV